ncbi:MAG: oxidoreductase [Bryobacteraceae bacterium]|jgi:scyllo-inositol 2-dehydrogenase (NADP+)
MDGIPVGLVGYGVAGAFFHAPLIRRTPGLRLASVATSRKDQVERLPGGRAVSRVAELLANPSIQLVVVATPTSTHFEIARAALLAGKHVVVDKPLALTVREGDELISLAQRQGRVLSVYQNRRWDGDYLTVKRCVSSGWLGTLYHYEAHYDRYRVEVRARWRERAGPGSGMLYDLAPHLIDQALQLFGMPEAVSADVFAQRPGAETDDYFHLVLHYGRMRAILQASMLMPRPGPHFAIHGDRGSFFKYGMDPQEAALKAGGMPGDPGWGAEDPALYGELFSADGSRRTVETLPGGWEAYYAAMAACLAEGGPPPVDPADARDGLRVIEAAMRSADERRTIELD